MLVNPNRLLCQVCCRALNRSIDQSFSVFSAGGRQPIMAEAWPRSSTPPAKSNSAHCLDHHPHHPHHRHQHQHRPTSCHGHGLETEGHAAHRHMRWLILFLSCWIMFGNYYAFDNPSALNRPLHGQLAPLHDEKLFQYRFSLLYSVYSIPNVVLPFFVGRLLDRWGSRFILIVLSLLVALGQMMVAHGVGARAFVWTTMGRIIFGVGGESLAVAQSRLVTHWFEGKELALAIGLNLSIARIGTVVNNILSPVLAERFGVPLAFWAGFLTCLLSFLCTVLTVALDKRHRPERCDDMDDDKCRLRRRRHHDAYPRVRLKHNYDAAFWILALICFLFYVSWLLPEQSLTDDADGDGLGLHDSV